jgi:hypothetical protein
LPDHTSHSLPLYAKTMAIWGPFTATTFFITAYLAAIFVFNFLFANDVPASQASLGLQAFLLFQVSQLLIASSLLLLMSSPLLSPMLLSGVLAFVCMPVVGLSVASGLMLPLFLLKLVFMLLQVFLQLHRSLQLHGSLLLLASCS